MKTKVATIFGIIAAIAAIGISTWMGGVSYGQRHLSLEKAPLHEHVWSQWADPTASPDTSHGIDFIQFRHCTNCGMAEFRPVLKVR